MYLKDLEAPHKGFWTSQWLIKQTTFSNIAHTPIKAQNKQHDGFLNSYFSYVFNFGYLSL